MIEALKSYNKVILNSRCEERPYPSFLCLIFLVYRENLRLKTRMLGNSCNSFSLHELRKCRCEIEFDPGIAIDIDVELYQIGKTFSLIEKERTQARSGTPISKMKTRIC